MSGDILLIGGAFAHDTFTEAEDAVPSGLDAVRRRHGHGTVIAAPRGTITISSAVAARTFTGDAIAVRSGCAATATRASAVLRAASGSVLSGTAPKTSARARIRRARASRFISSEVAPVPVGHRPADGLRLVFLHIVQARADEHGFDILIVLGHPVGRLRRHDGARTGIEQQLRLV